MEFLRQLTFENGKWTKNFESFETVDDILDEDEIENTDTSKPVKEKMEKPSKKRTISSISEEKEAVTEPPKKRF